MPTPMMWKALDRHDRYFSLYWNCPYRWNAKAGKVEYNGKLWSLKGWVLAQFTTILNLLALVGCLLACNFSKSCSFSLTELIIIAITTGLAFAIISFDALLLYSEDAILAFNCLKEIDSFTMKRGKCWGEGQKKLDVVTIFYQGITIMFAVYPYFLTFFGIIIFNLDPLYYAAKQLQLIPFFHSHFFLHLTFVFMRVLLAYPGIVQGCRLITLLDIVGGVLFTLMKDAVCVLQAGAAAISFGWRSRYILQMHATLEILLNIMHPFVTPVILVAMGEGLMLDTLFNYATLKLHGTIPMPLYLYFPSVSIFIPIIVQLLLPLAGNIFEADKKLQNEWGYYAKNSRNKRYLRRKLRCVRNLKIYAGLPGINIYPIDSSTKGTYYSAMVDYTITALLWKSSE